jgi:hypothetical protein
MFSHSVRVMLFNATLFQQYFSYNIMAVSFIGGGNRSTRRKLQTSSWSLYLIIPLCLDRLIWKEKNSKWEYWRSLNNDETISFCFKKLFFNCSWSLTLNKERNSTNYCHLITCKMRSKSVLKLKKSFLKQKLMVSSLFSDLTSI